MSENLASGKTVFITGASTGIGQACAIELDKLGWQVFAGVRKEEDALKLTNDAEKIIPVIVDITDYDSVGQAFETVQAKLAGRGLDALVNNAGISVQGPLEFIPMDLFEKQIKVNVHGHLAVTQAFLPLIRIARGRIVFMSSESGRVTLPMAGPYSASKFALEAIGNAFRMELLSSGIKVSLIEPGSIKTAIWEKVSQNTDTLVESMPEQAKTLYEKELKTIFNTSKLVNKMAIPMRKVTGAVVHALTAKTPKIRYLVGLEAWILTYFSNLTPTRLVDWIMMNVTRQLAKIKFKA
ncbi:MAG: SDR family oxidoreductase [Proteobacteria bacterium]|nr:SDR family oxidoreductase [Pseudomonadota bacterium]